MSGLEQDRALIRELVRFADLTAAEVAKKAKIDPSTVQRAAKGTNEARLSQRTVEKLRAAFPSFPGWTRYNEWMAPPSPATIDAGTVELEQIDLRYGMGGTYGDGPVMAERRSFSREWLRSISNTAPRHLFWAIGDGDSMEPTIRSGEVILVDRSNDTPRMDGGIWVVMHGEIGMIRRLRQLPDGTVELHSDNHLVRPQTAVDGELHAVGRVIAVVRRL